MVGKASLGKLSREQTKQSATPWKRACTPFSRRTFRVMIVQRKGLPVGEELPMEGDEQLSSYNDWPYKNNEYATINLRTVHGSGYSFFDDKSLRDAPKSNFSITRMLTIVREWLTENGHYHDNTSQPCDIGYIEKIANGVNASIFAPVNRDQFHGYPSNGIARAQHTTTMPAIVYYNVAPPPTGSGPEAQHKSTVRQVGDGSQHSGGQIVPAGTSLTQPFQLPPTMSSSRAARSLTSSTSLALGPQQTSTPSTANQYGRPFPSLVTTPPQSRIMAPSTPNRPQPAGSSTLRDDGLSERMSTLSRMRYELAGVTDGQPKRMAERAVNNFGYYGHSFNGAILPQIQHDDDDLPASLLAGRRSNTAIASSPSGGTGNAIVTLGNALKTLSCSVQSLANTLTGSNIGAGSSLLSRSHTVFHSKQT
jgi:hypothetical protein